MKTRVSKRAMWSVLGAMSVLVSSLASCAARGAGEPAAASTVASTGAKPDDASAEAAKRKLANAKKKLDAARLRMKQAEADDKAALKRLDTERELAEAELRQFDEQDAPNRLAQKRLETQGVRDQFADDQEELQQLEMMYAAEDLADQTKQIVLQRGKRKLGRSQERLAIEERALAVFEKFTLPRERAHLELEVAAKARALEAEKSGFAITRLEKQVEISEAEDAVKEIERALPPKPAEEAAPEKAPAK